MAAEQRKILEQLMGADALDPRSSRRQELDLHDPKICKSFLVGTCPHDLFVGTKQDLGPCRRQHMEKYKMEYEAQKRRGVEFPELELEYERDLERYVKESDMRVEEANAKLERTPEDEAQMAKMLAELESIDIGIRVGLEELELLGEAGEIMKAGEQAEVVEKLKEENKRKLNEYDNFVEKAGFSGHQKLQVCVLCGAYLSRLDNDRRLADHFMGKMHMGYRIMRAAYKEIKEKNSRLNRRRY